MKNCTGCGRDLPLDDFPADRSKPDGHHTRCRACKSAGSKAVGGREDQQRRAQLNEARAAALERLADRHDQEFVKLFYSEAVARGLVEPHGTVDHVRGLVA